MDWILQHGGNCHLYADRKYGGSAHLLSAPQPPAARSNRFAPQSGNKTDGGLPNERGGAPVSTEPASPTVHGYIRGRPAAGSPRHGTGVRSAIGRVLIFVPIARAETMRAESAATVASPPWTRTPSVDETTWGFLVIVSVRHYGERLKVEEKYMRNLLYQISLANVLQTR